MLESKGEGDGGEAGSFFEDEVFFQGAPEERILKIRGRKDIPVEDIGGVVGKKRGSADILSFRLLFWIMDFDGRRGTV